MSPELGDPFDVDDDSALNKQGEPTVPVKVKQEKRKREKKSRCEAAAARAVPSEDEGDLESPTKRASCAEERPLTAKDIRELLMGHVTEMRSAWEHI